MAQYTLKIPELGNAELKLTVDVERIPSIVTEAPADAPTELPGFAQLRPMRVTIQLGGEHVYQWTRLQADYAEPLTGAAPDE